MRKVPSPKTKWREREAQFSLRRPKLIICLGKLVGRVVNLIHDCYPRTAMDDRWKFDARWSLFLYSPSPSNNAAVDINQAMDSIETEKNDKFSILFRLTFLFGLYFKVCSSDFMLAVCRVARYLIWYCLTRGAGCDKDFFLSISASETPKAEPRNALTSNDMIWFAGPVHAVG